MRFPPSSLSFPSPTASTLPRCGFSLAVSGRTSPEAVVSSSSIAVTIRRSPRGLRFIAYVPPSWGLLSSHPGVARERAWHSNHESASPAAECSEVVVKVKRSESPALRYRVPRNAALVAREQPAAQEAGEGLAAVSHHPVVGPLEDGSGPWSDQGHPALSRRHVPLVDDGGDAALLEEPPAAHPIQATARVALEELRPVNARRHDLELDRVGDRAA